MDNWNSFINQIEEHLKKINTDFPLFRGHNDTTWKLESTLNRVTSNFSIDELEPTLYADFKSNCGPLYDKNLNSWEVLFEMRHAGLPTRLLDWSETFSSSIFFALKGVDWDNNNKGLQPCIWILNPFILNKKFYGKEQIDMAEDLGFQYENLIDSKITHKQGKFKGPIVFLTPRSQQRIFAQKSVFTLHDISFQPIEKICSECVKKFNIPINSVEEAKNYLFLSGTDEYSLYPDLDGLGRMLIERHNIKNKIS
jgi:hypothetical protein